MTDCEACKAAGQDHDAIVALCKSSPYWAGLILANFDWFKNSFHETLAEWFATKYNQGKNRFLIMTPRDHLKTSLFGVSVLLWRAITDPEDRVLYVMSSSTESAKTLNVVRDILATGEAMRHFFPSRVLDYGNPKHKGTHDYVRLDRAGIYRDGTIEARGIDSRITGGHFTWHVFDDLIDEKMSDSIVLQDAAIAFLKRSDALFVKASEDVEIIIGTRWPGRFYNWLLDESGIADSYEKLLIGCYVDDRYRQFLADIGKTTTLEDGDPIWPEHFTRDSLKRIEARAGPFDFGHQWLNLEMTDEDRRFNREDFQFYNVGPDTAIHKVDDKTHNTRFADMYRTLTIDPATGEHSKTDESAITVCGYDKRTGRIFVLDAWAGRALPFDLINKIIEMSKKWKPHVVAPEDVSFQKTFKHFMRQAMNEAGVHFPIRPVKPGIKSKGTRIIDSLQPFVANQQVYVLRKQRKLVDELVHMQVVNGKVVGKSPNLADSLAYHAQFWRGAIGRSEDQDEIDYMEQFKKPVAPAYGLECLT